MPPLNPAELAALRAVLDRLIPADDFPGALGAGTDGFVLAQLRADSAANPPLVRLGLARLDATAAAHHGPDSSFTTLAPAHQDALLAALDAADDPFFNRLLDLALQGYYADPANGGNRGAASWRMLGYDPRGASARTPSPP